MATISVRERAGAHKLADLGRALVEAGDGGKGLKRELLKGIRKSTAPAIRDVKASAASELPHRGGLAAEVAGARYGTRTRLAGRWIGVRIEGKSGIALRVLNAGRLRHPVFGHRDRWVQQAVPAHWFDRPIEQNKPQIQRSLTQVMADVAAKIERA